MKKAVSKRAESPKGAKKHTIRNSIWSCLYILCPNGVFLKHLQVVMPHLGHLLGQLIGTEMQIAKSHGLLF